MQSEETFPNTWPMAVITGVSLIVILDLSGILWGSIFWIIAWIAHVQLGYKTCITYTLDGMGIIYLIVACGVIAEEIKTKLKNKTR